MHALLHGLRQTLRDTPALETQARRIAQSLVLLVQGKLMLAHAPADMAEAFLASRIDAAHGRIIGSLPAQYVNDNWLQRAWPEISAPL